MTSTTVRTSSRIAPTEVHDALQKHMLVDGYRLVIDLEKSHGSWVVDARRGREVLDFYTSFATLPLGYNPPKLHPPEFRQRILPSALNATKALLARVESAEKLTRPALSEPVTA